MTFRSDITVDVQFKWYVWLYSPLTFKKNFSFFHSLRDAQCPPYDVWKISVNFCLSLLQSHSRSQSLHHLTYWNPKAALFCSALDQTLAPFPSFSNSLPKISLESFPSKLEQNYGSHGPSEPTSCLSTSVPLDPQDLLYIRQWAPHCGKWEYSLPTVSLI